MRDFRKLSVWEKAHRLTLDIYRVTRDFPPEERFGVTSQLQRAAASIPTNVAEGCGRFGDRERAHFVSIATGSATELEYLLILSRDLGYVTELDHDALRYRVVEVRRMLSALRSALKQS